MKELLIGLLGGGAIVQLVSTLSNLRPARRHANASALGAEVEALEKTIKTLGDNFNAEMERHRAERDSLRQEISELNARISELNESILSLRRENSMLRSMLEGKGEKPEEL